MATSGDAHVKVIDGWLADVRDGDRLVEFVLSIALHDVVKRAEGAPRPRGAALTRVWAGEFVVAPARRPRRSDGTPARRAASDRRPRPPVLDGIPHRDRIVAEGVAELLLQWAEGHNAG